MHRCFLARTLKATPLTRLSSLSSATTAADRTYLRSNPKTAQQTSVRLRQQLPGSRQISTTAAAMTDPKEAGPKPTFEKQDQDFPGQEHKMNPKPDYGYDSYKGHNKLQDKIAIVTGGDSGIGRAVCLAYAREGAHVAIHYLNEHQDAEETKRVVEEAGRECILISGDLEQEEVCKKVVDETVNKWGRVDIFVGNAGMQLDAVEHFTQLSRERITKTIMVNVIANISISQKVVPHMAPGGAIIFTSSIQAYNPSAAILDYATTKGALVALTKGLAQQLIKSNGIRVNTVAPGPVWTPLIVESFPPEKVEQFGKSYPPERPAQPRELAPAYVFLACNEDSSYVNGEVLGETGGKPIG